MSATPAAEGTRPLPDGYRPLPGSERKPARGAQRVNPANPDDRLTVSVYVRRNPDAPPLAELEDWMAGPPGHREFLTREDMATAHGAAQADLDAVTQFGRNHGLTVTETSPARRMVALTGTVRQMNDAFVVDLGQYESPVGHYRGREGPVHLPGDIADVVVGVFGLDDRPMARRASNGTGPPGGAALTPPQVAKLYNFPAGSAAGQTIGILEFGGGYERADIKAFFSGLNQTTPKIHAVSVDGVTNSPTGDPKGNDSEVVLDIDVAGSVGVGANIAVYFAPVSDRGWADAITTAVLEPAGLPAGWAAPSVLTCSWGFTELEADVPTGDAASPWPFEWTQQAINLVSGTYQQAAMMGVTIFNCSFDDGSNQQQNDGNAHVAYPGSDAWVTTCGGTRITNVAGSAFTESTWNDDAFQTGAATGGGISDAIGLPAWQQNIVPPSVNPGGRIGRGPAGHRRKRQLLQRLPSAGRREARLPDQRHEFGSSSLRRPDRDHQRDARPSRGLSQPHPVCARAGPRARRRHPRHQRRHQQRRALGEPGRDHRGSVPWLRLRSRLGRLHRPGRPRRHQASGRATEPCQSGDAELDRDHSGRDEIDGVRAQTAAALR